MHDAVLALISLGYKQLEAHKAIKQSLASASGTPACGRAGEDGLENSGMSDDKMQRAEAIRSALPEGGLFHEKSWRVSPDAFLIDRKFAEEIDKLGYRLYALRPSLQSALSLQYKRSPAGVDCGSAGPWEASRAGRFATREGAGDGDP